MGSTGENQGYSQLESNGATVSRLAEHDKVPWYNKPNLRLLYFLMVPTCFAVEMTNGFSASLVNGLQAVPSWLEYYDHPRSTSLGLMTAMYPLGSVVALPFVPFVVDRMGRRFPILLGGLISIFGAMLTGFAASFTMFIVGQFILGFANILCTVAASSLIGELAHPKERAVVSCLFISSYDLGSVCAAAAILRTFALTNNLGWRIPSFLQAAPSLLQVLFIWYFPESPRWLTSVGRRDEAYSILVKYHAEGDENSDFVKAEYTQIEEALEAELKSAMNQKKALSTPGMQKRMVIAALYGLFSQWCGIGLTSYLLSPILDSIGIHDNLTKNVINFAKVSWSLVNSTFFAFTVPHYPRRRIFLLSTVFVFILFTALTVATAEYSFIHDKISAQAVLVLIFLYGPAYNMGFGALIYTYLVELFPFHARAKGISVFQWFYRGGGFLNQLVNPIGIDLAGWRWYIVYCVWDAFQVVFIYLAFPETSGRTLEELTFLFEDDEGILDHRGVESLCANSEIETYGTMASTAGSRTVHGLQDNSEATASIDKCSLARTCQ